jgi:hypothetical protein
MTSIRRFGSRLLALFRGHDRADADLRAEMEAHLEMEVDEYVRRGMTPAEARRQALMASGGLTQAAAMVREQRSLPRVESMAADLRYAVRHFSRTPLSTVTMILVLSLGIGTNVVLFTVLNSLATMPAPGIARDQSLVRIRGTMRSKGMAASESRLMSWPEVQQYAARTDLFTRVAAHADVSAVVSTGDATSAPTTVRLVYVTANYFGTLGVQPALGTEPAAEPDVTRMSASPTAVISHAMWQQRFGGAPDVIGRTLRINDFPVQIVGVAPPRFAGTVGCSGMTMWVPLAIYPLLQKRDAAVFISRDELFLTASARLHPGVTPDAATPIVAAIASAAFDPARQPPATTVVPDDVSQPESGSADVVPLLASNRSVSARRD